ncbi:MAG: histidine phosphatase family protein [Dokdonella sp.]|uniref:phosphoglycerate mutase family protein n=1 Tax=Dokdonella sp. TaxID=2291710 RepID=UPI0025BA14C9|nr:phosphoglycerate mutase family protein [Dokdonella sp.]MBK8122273.1 histidine phosphatase family protein [Dokdonella sp.]
MTLKMLFVLVLLIATTPSAVADKTSAPLNRQRHHRAGAAWHYLPNPDADKKLGPGLSVLGVAQAQMAGARLVGFPGGFDALYVSPMQRARDTAAAIAQEFPGRSFSIIDGLEECTPPTWRKEVADKEDPASMAACKKQLDGVFDEYFKPAQENRAPR